MRICLFRNIQPISTTTPNANLTTTGIIITTPSVIPTVGNISNATSAPTNASTSIHAFYRLSFSLKASFVKQNKNLFDECIFKLVSSKKFSALFLSTEIHLDVFSLIVFHRHLCQKYSKMWKHSSTKTYSNRLSSLTIENFIVCFLPIYRTVSDLYFLLKRSSIVY